jgi:hypothetical protein
VGVELVGHHRREAGVASLSHLQVLGDDRHRVVGGDPHEGVRRESVGRMGLRPKAELDDQGGARRDAGLQESAASYRGMHHDLPRSFAASWMAARIRT